MIKKIIIQQREERDFLLSLPYIQRFQENELAGYMQSSLIKLITGPRRAGKSVMALQLLKVYPFAYLNFDDKLLLNHFDEDEVLKAFHEVYAGFQYVMLDEIQNLSGWEIWVNKLYRRGFNLVITGSNAKLLSHEMASLLTGRYVQLAVFPFSFHEVLTFNAISMRGTDDHTPVKTGKVLHHMDTYLKKGGFPETLLHPEMFQSYLSTLFDAVLLKDVVNRFKVRQTRQLYDLASYLLANYTNPYTYNQLAAELQFNSVATVKKFVGYLEEPYLFLNLTRYHHKIKQQQKSPVKSYIIDSGFVMARSFELSPNHGRLLENAVFVELLRRQYQTGQTLFYYRTRNNREVDFLLRDGHKVSQLIQVSYDISGRKTLKRELQALTEAAGELSCSDLLLINWDQDEIVEQDQYCIKLMPASEWFCNFYPDRT